jgi:hypothetical protein
MPDLISTVLQLAQPLQDDVENLSAAEVLRYYSQPRQYPAGTSGLYQVVMDLVPILLLSRSRRKQKQKEREWKRLQEEASIALDIYNRWQNLGPTDYDEYLKLQREALGAMGRLSLSPLRALVGVVSTTPPVVKDIQLRQIEEAIRTQGAMQLDLWRQQLGLAFEPAKEAAMYEVKRRYEPGLAGAIERERLFARVAGEEAEQLLNAVNRIEGAAALLPREKADEIFKVSPQLREALKRGDTDRFYSLLSSIQDPDAKRAAIWALVDASFSPKDAWLGNYANNVLRWAAEGITNALAYNNFPLASYYAWSTVGAIASAGGLETAMKFGSTVLNLIETQANQQGLLRKDIMEQSRWAWEASFNMWRSQREELFKWLDYQFDIWKEYLAQERWNKEYLLNTRKMLWDVYFKLQDIAHGRAMDYARLYLDAIQIQEAIAKTRLEMRKLANEIARESLNNLLNVLAEISGQLSSLAQLAQRGIQVSPQTVSYLMSMSLRLMQMIDKIIGGAGTQQPQYQAPPPTQQPTQQTPYIQQPVQQPVPQQAQPAVPLPPPTPGQQLPPQLPSYNIPGLPQPPSYFNPHNMWQH